MSDAEKLAELIRLNDEALRNYFEKGDGHCKSSEGHISVHFGTYFDREEGRTGISGVEIYAYVLGPSRSHYFDSLDDALNAMREWHKAEMEHDYSEDGFIA